MSGLEEVLGRHAALDSGIRGLVACGGDGEDCASLFSPGNHNAHLATAVRAWVAEVLASEGVREAVERTVDEGHWEATACCDDYECGKCEFDTAEIATAALAAITSAVTEEGK